MTTSVWCHSH